MEAETAAEERDDKPEQRYENSSHEVEKAILTETHALRRRVRTVFLVSNAAVLGVLEEGLQAIEDQPPLQVLEPLLASLESNISITRARRDHSDLRGLEKHGGVLALREAQNSFSQCDYGSSEFNRYAK